MFCSFTVQSPKCQQKVMRSIGKQKRKESVDFVDEPILKSENVDSKSEKMRTEILTARAKKCGQRI